MFDSVVFDGVRTLTIHSNTLALKNTVAYRMLTDTWQEDPVEYDAFTNKYKNTSGSFDILLQGPTTSGIMAFYQELLKIKEYANRFAIGKNDQQQFLRYDAITSNRIYTTNIKISPWIKYTNINALDAIKCTVEYERRPFIFQTLAGNTEPPYPEPTIPSTITTLNENTLTVKGKTQVLESPTSLGMALSNQAPFMPSGYLLISNYNIFTISGGYFTTDATAKHPAQTNVNENTLFPYSVSTGGPRTGVMKTTPVAYGTILTSGTVYANFSNSIYPVNFYGGYRRANVFLTYRTSGVTEYDVGMVASNTNNRILAAVEPRRLKNITYPQCAFLGELFIDQDSLDLCNLQMNITPATDKALGGSLFIDRVIVQPTDEISNTIQFATSYIPHRNTLYADGTTASGLHFLELRHSYHNLPEFRPSINVTRYIRGAEILPGVYDTAISNKIVPSYRGDIEIAYKMRDAYQSQFLTWDEYKTGHFSMLFVATGSTYNTVSGLNNWVHTDRANTKTKVALSLSVADVQTDL